MGERARGKGRLGKTREKEREEKKLIQKERLNLKELGHEIDSNFLTEMGERAYRGRGRWGWVKDK